jgi:hypothetical protein
MSEETITTDANTNVESTPQTADNEGVTSAPEAEVEETSNVEESSEEAVDDKEESVEGSEGSRDSDSGEEERKPTRAERRIQELVAKTKQQEELLEKLSEPNPGDWKGQLKEPLITPDEYQEGVDPKALEQRIEKRVAQTVQRTLAMSRQQEAYKGQLEAHTQDLQTVVDKYPELTEDPALEEAFLDAYNDANYINGGFVPRKTPSEIAAKIMKIRDSVATKSAAQVSGKMAKHAAEQAVSPRASEVEEKDYEAEESYKKARSSRGNTEAWADYFKKTGLASVSKK